MSPYIHNLGAYKLHYHYTITIIEQRVVSFTMTKNDIWIYKVEKYVFLQEKFSQARKLYQP